MGLRSLTTCICGIYARFRSGARPSAQVDKLLERSDGTSDVACLRPADCHFDAPTAVSVAIASSVRWPNANNDAHPGSNPLTSIVPSHRVAPNLEVLLIAHPFITSPFPFFFHQWTLPSSSSQSGFPRASVLQASIINCEPIHRIYIYHLFTFHSFSSHDFFDQSNVSRT